MRIWWVIILFLLGLALIIKGGDFFVDAATWIAEVSGVPKFVIGATIVSVATTLPELLVSIIATAEGNLDIAVGNSVGSVVANIGLIMGISMVCLPSVMKRKDLLGKGILLIASITLLWLFSLGGNLNFWEGIIVILIFGLFIFENLRSAKKHEMNPLPAAEGAAELSSGAERSASDETSSRTDVDKETSLESAPARETVVKRDKKTITINVLKFLFGTAFIVVGAQLLVTYGSELAVRLNVPESIIAVTMVAIGTSLPELVTTITAIAKKQASLSVGNIIGANIIDLTLILPVCSFISGSSGLDINSQTICLDMPVCLGFVLISVVPSMITGKFARWQGITLLALYIGYIVVLSTGVLGF